MQPHIVLKPSDNIFVTISNTSTSLPTPNENVIGAILTVETGDVRMRYDGVAPDGGVGGGMPMVAGSVWEFQGRDILTNMRFYRDAAVDAFISGIYLAGH